MNLMAFNTISVASSLRGGVVLVLYHYDHLDVLMEWVQHFLDFISYTRLQRLFNPLGVVRQRPDV